MTLTFWSGLPGIWPHPEVGSFPSMTIIFPKNGLRVVSKNFLGVAAETAEKMGGWGLV